MNRDDEAVSYAKDVYAACATIGFKSASVDFLKALLDAPKSSDPNILIAAAQKAQQDSVAWASR